jgi:hypothetical protein
VKFIGNDPELPSYSDFLNNKKQKYTKKIISDYEKKCLCLLDYNLLVTSSYDLLRFLLKDLIEYFQYKNEGKNQINIILSRTYYNDCLENLDYFKQDSRSIKYSNIHIVISSVFLTAEETEPPFLSDLNEYLSYRMIHVNTKETFKALKLLKKYFLITIE